MKRLACLLFSSVLSLGLVDIANAAAPNACSQRAIKLKLKALKRSYDACDKSQIALGKLSAARDSFLGATLDIAQLGSGATSSFCSSQSDFYDRSTCRKAFASVSKRRSRRELANHDKRISRGISQVNKSCGRAATLYSETDNALSQCASSSGYIAGSSAVSSSPALLALSAGPDGDPNPECVKNGAEDQLPEDGTIHCHTIGGVTVTVDPPPEIEIPLFIPNRGPGTSTPPDPGPIPGGSSGHPTTTPQGYDICGTFPGTRGSEACLVKIKQECHDGLQQTVDRISSRCPKTAQFLHDTLDGGRFYLYEQTPEARKSTDEMGERPDTIFTTYAGYSFPARNPMMVGSNMPGDAIALNSYATNSSCTQVKVLNYPANMDLRQSTTYADIDELVIHEALHIILNLAHGSDLNFSRLEDDPIYKLARRSDCGEPVWDQYAK